MGTKGIQKKAMMIPGISEKNCSGGPQYLGD